MCRAAISSLVSSSLDFEEEVVAASNFRSDEAVALKVISHCEMQLFCVFFRSGYIKLYLMLDACLPLYSTPRMTQKLRRAPKN